MNIIFRLFYIPVFVLAIYIVAAIYEGSAHFFSGLAVVLSIILIYYGLLFVGFRIRRLCREFGAACKPSLKAYPVVDGIIIYLVIKNFGRSEARNLKINFTPDLKDIDGNNLSNALFSQAIGNFPPLWEIKYAVDDGPELFAGTGARTYEISFEYDWGDGHKAKESDRIDLNQYTYLSRFQKS